MTSYIEDSAAVQVQKKQKIQKIQKIQKSMEDEEESEDDDSVGSLVNFIVKDDDDESSVSISESGQKDSQKTEIEELFDGLKSMNCDLNLLQKNTINEKGIRRSTRQRKTPLRFTEEFKEDIQKCLLDDIPPEELPVALGLGSDDDGDSCAGSFCADEEEDEDYEICTDESSEVSLEDDDDDQDEDGVVDEDEENDEENDDELLLPNGQRV